jgi:hypothetical protein
VELNIVNEVATLQRLSVGQLRQRFAELFGETTKASNRTWLVKRILWRLQALAEGDLSERARRATRCITLIAAACCTAISSSLHPVRPTLPRHAPYDG